MGFMEGLHITISFDEGNKTISWSEIKSVCLDQLCTIHIPLDFSYPQPTWHRYHQIKMDSLRSNSNIQNAMPWPTLHGEWAFMLKKGDGEHILDKVKIACITLIPNISFITAHTGGHTRQLQAPSSLPNILHQSSPSFHQGQHPYTW